MSVGASPSRVVGANGRTAKITARTMRATTMPVASGQSGTPVATAAASSAQKIAVSHVITLLSRLVGPTA